MHPAADSTLLIVDMQARLMPVIDDAATVTAQAVRLARAARLLEVPVVATEHHLRVLGPTVEPLRESIQRTFQKMHFPATGEPGFTAWLPSARGTVFLAGCEAHICVLQTALGLAALGRRPVIVAGACGSRRTIDRDAAYARARCHGIDVVTVEMALFEWMETCEHPQFKAVLQLVK
jgi:nicotinamidase-related amidase